MTTEEVQYVGSSDIEDIPYISLAHPKKKEYYVKLVEQSRALSDENVVEEMSVYCPIDVDTGHIQIGLTLIDFVPEGAEVIGEFEEMNNILKLYDKSIEVCRRLLK